jgi:hypothetical protein
LHEAVLVSRLRPHPDVQRSAVTISAGADRAKVHCFLNLDLEPQKGIFEMFSTSFLDLSEQREKIIFQPRYEKAGDFQNTDEMLPFCSGSTRAAISTYKSSKRGLSHDVHLIWVCVTIEKGH